MTGRTPNYPRLRALVTFIQVYTEFYGYAPDFREMGEAISNNHKPASTSLVRYYLDDLKERGVLDYAPRKNRTVHLLPDVDIDQTLPPT